MLDEVVNSTIHRCLEAELMEPSVSRVFNFSSVELNVKRCFKRALAAVESISLKMLQSKQLIPFLQNRCV